MNALLINTEIASFKAAAFYNGKFVDVAETMPKVKIVIFSTGVCLHVVVAFSQTLAPVTFTASDAATVPCKQII